mgnify:CR=1 FL=1
MESDWVIEREINARMLRHTLHRTTGKCNSKAPSEQSFPCAIARRDKSWYRHRR